MSTAVETAPQMAPTQKNSSRGCLIGCLIVLVLLFLLATCSGVGGYYIFNGQIDKYTSETPVELPTVEFTEEQLTELKDRLESFSQALEEDQPVGDLTLTADEINAIIETDDFFRGKAFIRIENGQVSGDVSIPTTEIPGAGDRYINASVSFDVSLVDGELVVKLVDAEVKGEKVPSFLLNAFSNENLAADLNRDPDSSAMIQRFENIRIEEDKIIFEMRMQMDSDMLLRLPGQMQEETLNDGP